jgi:hypothetical protein
VPEDVHGIGIQQINQRFSGATEASGKECNDLAPFAPIREPRLLFKQMGDSRFHWRRVWMIDYLDFGALPAIRCDCIGKVIGSQVFEKGPVLKAVLRFPVGSEGYNDSQFPRRLRSAAAPSCANTDRIGRSRATPPGAFPPPAWEGTRRPIAGLRRSLLMSHACLNEWYVLVFKQSIASGRSASGA